MAQTELTQVTLRRTLGKNRESILLISDTRPGIYVYKIILPEDSPVVFSETNNNIIESELVNNAFRGKLKFVKMKLIPGVTIRDLYKKPYKIIVHTHGVNAHDQIENQRRYETSLLPESVGGFHTSISELLFFDIGSPPQLATLSNIRTEYEDVKSRFSVGSVDITPTIGLGYARFETSRNRIAGRATQIDDIVAARNNPASLITLYNLNELKDRTVPPEITLTKIENVSSDYISYRVDYLVNAIRGLSGSTPTPQGSLFDEVNQIYFMSPFTSNPMIVVNCNDGVVVDRVEIVRSLIASGPDFTVTGNPVKNDGLKGYTQSLTLKPIKAIEDIVDNRCTIRVTVSKSGKRESREFDLVDGARGRFAGQAMFFAFFNHGIIPSKITYGDFQHEHPYGRKPILFKAYENNGTTLLPETSAVSFFIRDGRPTPFYPIRRNPSQDYWGMPISLEKNGRNSKIPNIAVIDTNKIIRKLSDYSERSSKFIANYSTFLVFDKKHNRLEFKLYGIDKTISKNIEYFIASGSARSNLAQPETRLSTMAIFFVDDESGLPIIIADFGERDRENQFTRDKINSYSYTDDLRDTARLIDQSNYHTYNNTFSISVHNNGITRVFNKLISAGRKGKVVIAFHTGDASNTQSIYDYKYAYSCRLRDDIVQHTSDSRFLVFTGVDDIYTIPKMVDLQVTGHNSFTNKLLSGGIIYDADSMSSKYNFDHPRYDGLFIQPYTGSSMLYGMHREDDLTFNTSDQPSHTHSFARGNGFSYDNTTELLVVSMEGIADWEHSVEAIGVIGAGALPSPAHEPGDISSDFESFVFLTDIPANEAVFAARIKDGVSVEKYGKTVLLNVYNDQGEKIYNELHIKSYRQNRNMRHLGLRGGFDNVSSLMSSYLDVELLSLDFVPEVGVPYTTDNAKVIGRLRLNSLTNESEYTDNSIVPNKRFKGVKTIYDNKTVYYRIFGFPSSLKKTGVDPVYILEPDNKLGIVLKDTAFTTGAIDRSINITHDSSKASGSDNDSRPVIRNAINSINGNYEQDYNVLNISEADNQPREIINAVTQYHIPNIGVPGSLEGMHYGVMTVSGLSKVSLYIGMNDNRLNGVSHTLDLSVSLSNSNGFHKISSGAKRVADNETWSNSGNPRKFDLGAFVSASVAASTLVLRHQMTLTDVAPNTILLKDYILSSGNDSISRVSYGSILTFETEYRPAKCTIRLTKTEGNPRVEILNAQGVSIQNTVGKLICMKPGTDGGLVTIEISHGKDSNPIEVPLSHFTKKGNEDKYELLFLIKGHDANADHIIGHAAISLTRNQLKEDSADYDFGLGQILMILNKTGNGAVIKAMVPHGLLSRADEFVLLNERQPNSTYNVTMETGGLYDIVSIDGALKDAPQPGSTVLQFGIRKDGELKRGKRITLTQLNTSVDVENHDNANKRVYSFGYGMADTSNRIDVKLVKIEDRVHVFFTNEAGINVSHEVDGFTLVHNSVEGNVIAAVGQIDKKLKRSSGSFALSISDYPQLGKMAEIVNGNDKHHGVVLIHRPVSGNASAIYHSEGFVHTSSELPLMNLSSFGVRYIRVNLPEADKGLTVGVGKEWYHRYTSPSSEEYNDKGLKIPRIEYTNANGGISISGVSTESERGIVTAAMTSGKGVLPRDIQEGNDKYAEFTMVNPVTNQPERIKLYKDPYDPRLYARRYTPRTTDVKYIAYHSEVNNQHILPLPGVIKRSDKIRFDMDYTLRRNALVRDMDVVNRERFLPFDHIYRIVYIDRSRYNNFAEINTFFSILSRSREVLSAKPYTSGISTSAYYSGLLPDINQDFTENCGEVNKTRDLSDWRMEATLLDLTARLDMSEYPIMEITGTDMQPISTDILRIRGPRNGKPIILNKEYNQIFTTPPRILVIEEDIQFAAAAGTNVREMILFNSNLSIIPTIIFRGRLIVHGLSSGLIGITQSFTVINDTQWDFYQLLSGIPLPNRSTDTNASTSIGTTSPTTSEATIDIVSEYIYERTGSTSLSSNIVGARKFISISKKDNLYGPYDNMVNESGNSSDLAVVEIAVKLPGDNNKYPIAVDKKTRHYVGDTVRYYISGNLPEPLRRNPWDDPLQVEIVTTIYRGVGNGSRYEIIRSARGRLVSWQHPQ